MDGWNSLLLGKCGKWLSGGTPSRDNPEYWGGNIPWVSGKSLHNYYISEAEEYVTPAGANNGTRLVPPGTILLLVRGMMLHKKLPVGITTREVAFNQDVKAIIPDKNLHPEFLLYWFITHARQILNYVEESSHGTGRLPTDILQRTEVKFPPLPEQRKIAEILSTWDEAIQLVEALIAALKERKRGLMQRLLTGEVRFAGFVESAGVIETKFGNIPADWRYVPISEIARSVSAKNADGSELPVLSCTKYDGLVDSLEYFGRQIYSEDTSTYKIVERNQFAYATNHIEEGSIGYQDLYDRALVSPMYTVFETTERINDSYLYKVLKTELYRHIFEVSTSASVNRRGSLRWGEFSKIHVPLPNLAEQKYIAEVIDSADAVIEQYAVLRDTLREQKKGLMQRLLTGEVRVNV